MKKDLSFYALLLCSIYFIGHFAYYLLNAVGGYDLIRLGLEMKL
jgi:hypothetical protein